MRMDRTTSAPVGTFAAHRSPIPPLPVSGFSPARRSVLEPPFAGSRHPHDFVTVTHRLRFAPGPNRGLPPR